MASGAHKTRVLGVGDPNGRSPQRPSEERETSRERAGPGPAGPGAKVPQGGPTLACFWPVFLVKGAQVGACSRLLAWEGFNKRSPGDCKPGTQYPVQGNATRPSLGGAGWRGVERCRSGAPVPGCSGLGRGSCNLAVGPAERPAVFPEAHHPTPRPPGGAAFQAPSRSTRPASLQCPPA